MTTLDVCASNVFDLELMLTQHGFVAGLLSPGTVCVALPSDGMLVAYGAYSEGGATFYSVVIHNAASFECGDNEDALGLPGYLTAAKVLGEVRDCFSVVGVSP